jgi:hypothetical protein
MLSGSKGLIRSTANGTDFANSFGKALWRHLSSRQGWTQSSRPVSALPTTKATTYHNTLHLCISLSCFPFLFSSFSWIVSKFRSLGEHPFSPSGCSACRLRSQRRETAVDQQNIEVLSVRLRRNFGSSVRRSRFSSPVRASTAVDPDTFSH